MNQRRRKTLKQALELLDQAYGLIESVKCEEEEAYDNLPEGLQESEKGEALYENVEQLEELMENVETVVEEITESFDVEL